MAFALRTHIFAELTSDEIAAARDDNAIVLVPVGATEQHGPHLPVETDHYLAENVARRAAPRVEAVPVLVAPTLPYGFSPHHLSHPGTISLRLETYIALIRDVVRSLVESGFTRIVLINGHGGNNAPLRAMVGEMVTDGWPVGMVDYWAPSERQWVADLRGQLKRAGHACEFETALMMALKSDDPAERVRIESAAATLPPRVIQPWIAPGGEDDPITANGAAWPPIFQADDCGYYGDPGAADLASGHRHVEIVTAGLVAFLEAFCRAPLRLGVSRDPTRPGASPPPAQRSR